MTHFDHDFAELVHDRAGRIAPDGRPLWGKMSRDQMFAHLCGVFEYCMGRRGVMPDRSSFYSRNILGPLIVNGIIKIPKNVKVPRPREDRDKPLPECSLDTLKTTMGEYMAKTQAGELDPPRHPFFGELGVDGWAKFNTRHIDHHMRQFGV